MGEQPAERVYNTRHNKCTPHDNLYIELAWALTPPRATMNKAKKGKNKNQTMYSKKLSLGELERIVYIYRFYASYSLLRVRRVIKSLKTLFERNGVRYIFSEEKMSIVFQNC